MEKDNVYTLVKKMMPILNKVQWGENASKSNQLWLIFKGDSI